MQGLIWKDKNKLGAVMVALLAGAVFIMPFLIFGCSWINKKIFSQRLKYLKHYGFPLQLHDSAGRALSLLGFACGVSPVPLFPQEVALLPLQSPYLKEGKTVFNSNILLEQSQIKNRYEG